MVIRVTLFAALIAMICLPLFGCQDVTVGTTETEPTPVELGKVKWGRDLAAAKTTSSRTGKPILVLFQEVPG